MSEKSAYPISKRNLETHLKKVDDHFQSINRGSLTERDDLFKIMRGIGSGNENLMSREVQESVDVLRQGFSLYYEMYALLELQADKIDPGVSEAEKRAFLNSYSMFAASSLIEHRLDLLTEDKDPFPLDTKGITFNFDLSKDELLNLVLAKYFSLVSYGKRNSMFEEGIDVPRGSFNFFKHLKEQALEKRISFNPRLVDLVKDTQFKVADEFLISGFEASHEEKIRYTKLEFVPMLPHQVAGNVLAKKEMLRDMDRIALFDLIAKKNPILEIGGMSWSVLYDGLPGTGKSSLFRMGLTRLKLRCEESSEFWKSKNLGELKWTQIIIDQAVKDEYYGKTGKNLLEKLDPTKRADGIYIITTDDIDLLVSEDRNSGSGGADKDILNILMQYADGINTVIRGNVQWWAATNDATSMDPALRQRFIARYSVDGPQEWYDFSDIFSDKLGNWIKLGVVELPDGKDYKPYETRKKFDYQNSRDPGLLKALKKKFTGGITMRDIGELCYELKQKNPRFTGRAVNAVAEAVKKRINDYEIPEEWFTNPSAFFTKEYQTRVNMLKELCIKVSGEVITQEIERYAESETRYSSDKFESDVGKGVHEMKVRAEVAARLKSKYGGEK